MSAAGTPPLLELSNVRVHFPRGGNGFFASAREPVRAVDGVSLHLYRGETLGLVGESGCGKTTLGRAVLRLVRTTSGSVRFDEHELTTMSEREVRRLRPRMQLVFQDAGAALNPRWRVGRLVAEPLEIHRGLGGNELQQHVDTLFETVGLDPGLGSRLPRELSGGQRQRVGIARALALEPELLVCDEPTSALDLSIQAQIINLLQDLQEARGLSYLFIGHDLGIVRQISDRIAVMYRGKIVELAPRDRIFQEARHPYTNALLAAVPVADPEQARRTRPATTAPPVGAIAPSAGSDAASDGRDPAAGAPHRGCSFCSRCPRVDEVARHLEIDCAEVPPPLVDVGADHHVACHLFPTSSAGSGS